MEIVNYTKNTTTIDSSKDGVIIRKHIAGFAGGRALDIEGYTPKVIPCGLPIITNGDGKYKPLTPVSNAFSLPEGYSFAGICGATMLSSKPVPVVNAAVVNEVAMISGIAEVFPEGITDVSAVNLTAIKSALPHLIFEQDEAEIAENN